VTSWGIAQYLREHDIKGIVWHHPDGRMAKIKGKDFGINRKRIKAALVEAKLAQVS
jgi:hypothetical protein